MASSRRVHAFVLLTCTMVSCHNKVTRQTPCMRKATRGQCRAEQLTVKVQCPRKVAPNHTRVLSVSSILPRGCWASAISGSAQALSRDHAISSTFTIELAEPGSILMKRRWRAKCMAYPAQAAVQRDCLAAAWKSAAQPEKPPWSPLRF